MRDTANPKVKQYTDKRTGRPRYLVRYRKPDGRQTMKRGFATKRDAEQWLTAVEGAKQRGEFIDVSAGRAHVRDLFDGWLAAKRVHTTENHTRTLESAWRLHVAPTWGDSAVSRVLTRDVQEWVTKMAGDSSPTLVIRAHGVLAGVLDDAVRDRMVLTNPARGVRLPRKRGPVSRYLTHQQVEDVAKASGHDLLVYTLAYCGLRWGEAVALRAEDVSVLRRRLTVARAMSYSPSSGYTLDAPKGGRARTVPMPRFLSAMMQQRISKCATPSDLIFPAPKADYLRQPGKSRTVNGRQVGVKWWERALSTAEVPWMTPHDLRHTAASLAVQSGANVKAVQRMLGHSSAAMTLDRYADLFDSDLDDVADRMDAAREHYLHTDPREVRGSLGIARDA